MSLCVRKWLKSKASLSESVMYTLDPTNQLSSLKLGNTNNASQHVKQFLEKKNEKQ